MCRQQIDNVDLYGISKFLKISRWLAWIYAWSYNSNADKYYIIQYHNILSTWT